MAELKQYSRWEIAGPVTTGTVHGNPFTSMSPTQLPTEIAVIREWLRSNGFRGDHLAYPGGEFNADILTAAETYFTASSTVFQRPATLPPGRG